MMETKNTSIWRQLWTPKNQLTLVAFFYLLWSTIFLTPLPKWDDYDAVLRFLIEYIQHPSWGDRVQLIFAQHNEHRIVLSRLVYLAFYYVFGFVDLRFFQLLGDACWVFFSCFLLREIKDRKIQVVAAFLLFSLRPIQLFFFPMAAMYQYSQVLLSGLCLYYYAKPTRDFRNEFKTVLFLFLSALSGGGWIALFTAPIFRVFHSKRFTKSDGLFLFTCGLCAFYYFIFFPYKSPGNPVPLKETLSHPFLICGFFFGYIGNIFENFWLALITGLLLTFFSAKALQQRKSSFLDLLIGYVFTTAALTTLARSSFGVEYSLSSRYIAYCSMLCTSLLAYYETFLLSHSKWLTKIYWVAFIFYVDSSIKGVKDMAGHNRDLMNGKIIYDDTNPAPALEILKQSQSMGLCKCELNK